MGCTEDDATQYTAFVDAFAKALHAKGMRLSSDVGMCPYGTLGNKCADYKATAIDSVITMRTYWKENKTDTMSKWKSVVDDGVTYAGEKYIVGLNTNTPPDLYTQMFAYLTQKGVRGLAIWNAVPSHDNDDALMRAVKQWVDGAL